MVLKQITQEEEKLKLLSRDILVRIIKFLLAHILKSSSESDYQKLLLEKINLEANRPSSKDGEWKQKGKGKGKRKKKRLKRPGSGNKIKPEPDQTHVNHVSHCPDCNSNLKNQKVLETVSRIVEDIPEPPKKTIVTEEIQDRVWCPECKKIVTAPVESALPGSDIGLRAMVMMAYFWVVTALSLPNIQKYMAQFLQLALSTAGISKMMVRLSNIMLPVYDEIRENVKNAKCLNADETGWRINGILFWLWAFADPLNAFYWVDKSRGHLVVEKILGSVFHGILVTDAWGAYKKIECWKQTCMAHIFRKIRTFMEYYPKLKGLKKFYKKLKRIISDGKRLREKRKKIGEKEFYKRLTKIQNRLECLLNTKTTNSIFNKVIEIVRRQSPFILTFIEHENVPTHNNFAEFIIRMGVLKRKISGGSRSFEGAKAYAILLTIAETCLLRDISFKDFLMSSLQHFIKHKRPLLLSEYQKNNESITSLAA
jgi:transposase